MAPIRSKKQRTTSTSRSGTVPPNARAAQQLPLPPPFTPVDAGMALPSEPPRIFTIGHSNHDPGLFLALLRQHGVQTLVDVRSAPYSRYAPHFNRNRLGALLEHAGIRYRWCGDTLGGRPEDPACYRDGVVRKGKVDFAAMAERPWYQEGMQALMALAATEITAIMCSEEDPRRCHRHLLLEPSLREQGATVLHVRRDGSVETIPQDEPRPPASPSPQLALTGFGA
jgi:hypothetical protein